MHREGKFDGSFYWPPQQYIIELSIVYISSEGLRRMVRFRLWDREDCAKES
jgi:hypothetical protein